MRTLQVFLMRLAGTFQKEKTEGAFSEELEGHLQMHTDDNIRNGMSRRRSAEERAD